MKLYYAPGACSLSVHIVLREAKYKFELEKVDLAARRTGSGEDYLGVNPKGYVPALRLDDGTVMTEASVILQYLADGKPRRALAPRPRTPERYRLMEWMNFTSAELHKALGDFFNPRMTPEWREARLERLAVRFDYLNLALDGNPHIMGEFTVADAYLFNILNWTGLHRIDMSGWPNIESYMRRVAERPAVKKAMKTEGLK